MIRNSLILLILVSGITSCFPTDVYHNADDAEPPYPSCLDKKIETLMLHGCDEGKDITAYRFRGEVVYVLNYGDCGADMAYPVIDRDCNELGFIGGFIGNTVIKGEQFSNAEKIEVIWAD